MKQGFICDECKCRNGFLLLHRKHMVKMWKRMYSLWKAKEAPMISSFDSWNGLINIRKQLTLCFQITLKHLYIFIFLLLMWRKNFQPKSAPTFLNYSKIIGCAISVKRSWLKSGSWWNIEEYYMKPNFEL